MVGCLELCLGKGKIVGISLSFGESSMSIGRKSRVVGQGTWVLVLVTKL